MRAAAATLCAVLTAVLFTACRTASDEAAGQTISDASISTAVQSKLTGDRISNFARVDVGADHGVVTLTGVVQSADQKKRAAELARQVQGVKRVNNNLQIEQRPPRPAS